MEGDFKVFFFNYFLLVNRSTCESVMTVLRNNKDSLMAVLEAFVYDPLLNWRLIETGNKGKKTKSNAGNAGGPSTSGDNPGGINGSDVSQSNTDLNPLTGGDQIGNF